MDVVRNCNVADITFMWKAHKLMVKWVRQLMSALKTLDRNQHALLNLHIKPYNLVIF